MLICKIKDVGNILSSMMRTLNRRLKPTGDDVLECCFAEYWIVPQLVVQGKILVG